MIPLLAESSPAFTPGELAAFLGIVAFVLGLIVLAKKAFGHEPPLHKAFVDRAEYASRQDKLDAELKRHAERRQEIYERQTEQTARLAVLENETRSQTTALSEIKDEQKKIRDRFDASSRHTIDLLEKLVAAKK